MLKIKHFTKTYKGGKTAVEDLNLEILPGEIHGFIGHNGAGKTTTLRCTAGILDFEEGDIFIDNISIKEHPLECKKITAYIPDNPDLYEHLTGLQYLNFIGDVFCIPSQERKEKIKYYSDALEITDNLSDSIASYSHGMKQKTAVIGALIHTPKLLLLDEPFVGLDPKASHTLKMFMRKLCSSGSAVFFSTHVLDVAEKLCDRISIIQNGHLVASGKTDQVKGEQSLEDVFLELVEK